MKRAKKRHPHSIKPRNPLALDPVLRKGGAHARRDKQASRARLNAQSQREREDS